jgi:hypothetical protein
MLIPSFVAIGKIIHKLMFRKHIHVQATWRSNKPTCFLEEAKWSKKSGVEDAVVLATLDCPSDWNCI